MSWSGISTPHGDDWIGLYTAGTTDDTSNRITWAYTNGQASGSLALLVPSSSQGATLDFRLFCCSGLTRLAISDAVTIIATGVALSESPSPALAGTYPTVSWSGIATPRGGDWIGLYQVGVADTGSRANWAFTNGAASGSQTLRVPAGTVPGTSMEYRIFADNSYNRLATTASFVVNASTAAIVPNQTSVPAGTWPSATWSGLPSPSGSDWIAIYPVDASDATGNRINWNNTDGSSNGSLSLLVPSTVSPGAYDFRIFWNNSLDRYARSVSFNLTAPGTPVTLDQYVYPAGSTRQVSWIGIGQPASWDWIGLYPTTADDSTANRIAWQYTNGAASGTLSFAIPAGLASGSYQFRLFSNNSLSRIGASNASTVGPPDPADATPSTYGRAPTAAHSPDPVNLATGVFTAHADDLTMPGRLLNFTFTRWYNSADPTSGPLGQAWTHSYNWTLTDNGASVIVRQGDGVRLTHTLNPDGSYARPLGNSDTLTKNADGTFTLTSPHQVRYDFGTAVPPSSVANAGRLTRIREPAGNTLAFAYTAGNLTTITDTVGRQLSLSYDAQNRLTQLQDPIGRKVTYAYDGYSRLTSVTDRLGNATGQNPTEHRWQYAYDAGTLHLATITDPDGRVRVTNSYDSQGRVYEQRDGLNKLTTFAYGAGQTTLTDPRGHATTYTFDSQLRELAETDLVGAASYVLAYTYDACGNRDSVTDRRGSRTDYTYDTSCLGNLIQLQEPQLDQTTPRFTTAWQYDANNNLLLRTDAKSFTTSWTHDPVTNLKLSETKQIDATTSATTKWIYGDASNPGLPTRVVTPRGNTTGTPNLTYSSALAYDASGSLVSSTDADGDITTYGYDGVGRRTSMVDPDGNAAGGVPSQHTWTMTYDELDRVTAETNPLGKVARTGYDGASNRVTATDRDGNVTTFIYDGAARLWKVQQKPDPAGQPTLIYTTTNTRDDNGNITSVQQANGVVTDYGFDELNRALSMTTHPATATNLVTSYALDGNGNITTRTSGDSVATSYQYDALNRLTQVSATGLATIAYGYDELSQRTSMNDGTGASSYSYDRMGRLTQAVQPSGTLGYGYDLDSDRTLLTYPGGLNVSYGYSNAGRLATVTDGPRVSSYTYSASGLAKTVNVPGGMTTTYSYDNARRLVSLTNMVGPTTITSHTYTLDDEGNRTALDEIVSGITAPNIQSFPSVKVNSDTGTTVQDHPAIALGSDAASYLIWDDARAGNADIEFARRDPSTGTWSANVKVNTDNGSRIQQNPAIAVDSANNAYAVWQDERNGAGKADIYYAKRTASNGTWLTPNVKVSDDPGASGGAVQRNPRIAGTAAGAESAVWVDLRSSQNNIYGSTLAAGGSTWAANKRVTDNTAAVKDAPDVVVGSDGTSYAVWQDSRNGNADIYFSKLTSGGSTWSTNVKVSDDPGTTAQTLPRIGIDGAGNLTVIWLDARTSPATLRMSRQLAGTSVWTASSIVTDAAARPVATLGAIALAVRSDGKAWAAWGDSRGASTDIWGSQYDPTTGAWTTSSLVSDDTGAFAQSNPTLAYSTAELARAWRDDRAGNADIRAGRITYGAGTAEHVGYTYDGLERLTSGTTTNPESFVLDAGSNIASRTGPTATYTLDTANRPISDGTRTFTWSDADRLIGRGADTFGYDAVDRLIASTVAGTSRTYAYNGDHLLSSRTQGAATTAYLWEPSSSPSRLLQQGTDRIIYGLGPLYIARADGTTATVATDGQGSIRAEVNGSGAVTSSFRYRAYGEIAQASGAASPSILGYVGELQDPSGLIYLRARWYDPSLAVFMRRDTYTGVPENPKSLNGFIYAARCPTVLTDPTGLDPPTGAGTPCQQPDVLSVGVGAATFVVAVVVGLAFIVGGIALAGAGLAAAEATGGAGVLVTLEALHLAADAAAIGTVLILGGVLVLNDSVGRAFRCGVR